MTYYKVVCEFCGWLVNEYRTWDAMYDRVQVLRDAVCPLCLAELERGREEPASWFEVDIGEAGA